VTIRSDTDVGMVPTYRQIIKNVLNVHERGEDLLQNGILHFVLWLSQTSDDFFESGLALKRVNKLISFRVCNSSMFMN